MSAKKSNKGSCMKSDTALSGSRSIKETILLANVFKNASPAALIASSMTSSTSTTAFAVLSPVTLTSLRIPKFPLTIAAFFVSIVESWRSWAPVCTSLKNFSLVI
ncbi:uncharacterized protein LOC143374966 [Andrena cerasifolii]|uniref:uncharacterized protein LOC143374966 n=1 Tax=Andrena cerasifolii TaxID=2819439 RepID=UPI00403832D6